MQREFEKIIKRLEEEKTKAYNTYARYEMNVDLGRSFGAEKAIEIVNRVASEHGDGWIPVSSGKLPSDCAIHEVTAQFSNGKLYTEFAYYDEEKEEWWKFDDDGLVNVIAWKESSDPYQPNICNDTDCPYNDKRECPASEGCAGYERKNTKVQTNAERIQSMSIEELAEFLANLNGGGSVRKEKFLKWLQSEVEE